MTSRVEGSYKGRSTTQTPRISARICYVSFFVPFVFFVVKSSFPLRPPRIVFSSARRLRTSDPLGTRSAGSRLRVGVPTSTSRRKAAAFSGGTGIDVEAGAPLEARDLGQPRNHFDMPMVMRKLAVVKRRGVDDVIVGGPSSASSSLFRTWCKTWLEVVDTPAWGCSRSGWSGSWGRSRSRRETGWRTGRTR